MIAAPIFRHRIMGRVAGKVAIVTGGSRGLGAAQARHLAAEGARVVLTSGRSIELGEKVAAEIGGTAVFLKQDVSKAEDWERVVAETERRFGPINVLVNNAGIVIPASIENQTEAEFRETFEVNQLGTFLGIKTVLPSMRRAGGGSIINISSVAGLRSSVASIAYGATKFAIRGMTKKAAVELATARHPCERRVPRVYRDRRHAARIAGTAGCSDRQRTHEADRRAE